MFSTPPAAPAPKMEAWIMPTKPDLMRRHRHDRISSPDKVEIENAVTIDHIIGPLDRLRRRLDQKWGQDRLPEIVSTDLARKYGRAVETFEQAMMDEPRDPETIRGRVDNLMKGLRALDAAADEAGAERAPDDCIAMTVCGEPAALVIDRAAATAVRAQRPHMAVYTIEEVERIMSAAGMELVNRAKEIFEGAEVVRVNNETTKKWKEALDDEIPF